MASACVSNSRHVSIVEALALCRFFAGLGIGGEYPLSAAISQEMGQNLCLNRMTLLQINIAMLNFGSISQALLCLILVEAHASIEATWRTALAVGAFPSLLAFILRIYLVEHDHEQPHPRGRRLSSYHNTASSSMRSYFPILVCCSISWLLMNFSNYGQLTFSHMIAEQMLNTNHMDTNKSLRSAAIFAIICSSVSLVGNISSGYIIQNGIPAKTVQVFGFAFMTTFLWLCTLSHAVNWLATIFFMLNMMMGGTLGITTYTIPTTSFPKKLRATGVGIAAGMGKVGAVIGTSIFPIIDHNVGLLWTLFISGGVLLFGSLVTLATPSVPFALEGAKG